MNIKFLSQVKNKFKLPEIQKIEDQNFIIILNN